MRYTETQLLLTDSGDSEVSSGDEEILLKSAGMLRYSSSEESTEEIPLCKTQASTQSVRNTTFKKNVHLCHPRYVSAVRVALFDIFNDRERQKSSFAQFRLQYDRVHGVNYANPDPHFDAWMCVTRERRGTFPRKQFLQIYPELKDIINNIRMEVDLREIK